MCKKYPSLFDPPGPSCFLPAVITGILAAILMTPAAFHPPVVAGETQSEWSNKRKKGEKRPNKRDTEETEVVDPILRSQLQQYLNPTKMEFLDNGKVRLFFNFEKKSPEHEKIFTPPIQTKFQSNLRWTTARRRTMESYLSTGGVDSKACASATRGMRS